MADFNLSRAIAKDSVPHSGSINSAQWAAPERLTGQAYNKSADVYSFGVVIWGELSLPTLQLSTAAANAIHCSHTSTARRMCAHAYVCLHHTMA